MRKLYRVEIVCYVMADGIDVAGPLAVAEHQAGRAVECVEVAYAVCDYDWPDVIPAGEVEGRTCSEIVKAQRIQRAMERI